MYADPLDQASETEAENLAAAIEAAKRANSNGPVIQPKGFCHNCSDPVAQQQLFCDLDCAEDYEYVQQRKRANGHAR